MVAPSLERLPLNIGVKCYGSTGGSNPSSQGSTPCAPANLLGDIMAKNIYGATKLERQFTKGTSIGRRPITSTMNKHQRRSFKKYRGQGK